MTLILQAEPELRQAGTLHPVGHSFGRMCGEKADRWVLFALCALWEVSVGTTQLETYVRTELQNGPRPCCISDGGSIGAYLTVIVQKTKAKMLEQP